MVKRPNNIRKIFNSHNNTGLCNRNIIKKTNIDD